MDWTPELLVAHALCALEPGDTLVVQEGLSTDATAGFRLGGIEVLTGVRRTGPLPLPLTAAVAPAETLSGDEARRVGDRMTLRIDLPVPPEAARAVLFRETGGVPARLFPRAGGAWPTLDRFRIEGDMWVIDLVLEPPPGPHRYELILVPADMFLEPWPDGDPMWEEVRDAWKRGRMPGAVFELEVEAERG